MVTAHTAADTFHVEMTLNELEEGLSAQRFFRAHRSTLVNLGHVKEIEPYCQYPRQSRGLDYVSRSKRLERGR